jgi:hypothetical protein
MADKIFPNSGLPIRRSVELLPQIFQTSANDKFMSGIVDPLIQPGVLQKTVGYIGRRYGKTYNGSDIYLNTDQTLRSRYQLEPGVIIKNQDTIEGFYDYLDFKNQLKFFGNENEKDDSITGQEHYSWNPPIDWDKFINYREYYWEPSGPPAVLISGQATTIVSSYKVSLGSAYSFIFTPDGYTNNPLITLYRGQTYKFKIDAPNDGFVIRTNYDVGTLYYRPEMPYSKGQTTIFNGKVWKAKVDIAAGDGSTITTDSQDWEYISLVSVGTASDYNKGVTNNRIENGTLTFEVPYDAPDVLYYQSIIDPNKFGQFTISNIESNTRLDIEKEIIGKSQYTSSNGVEFSNGIVVEFTGSVTPEKYSSGGWLVEGVGEEIALIRFTDLIVPIISKTVPEVLFDAEGFDTQPFDDAKQYPGQKDYITINRSSLDKNPWSRYNRWFHRSVLENAYKSRGQDFPASEDARAKRPIIEFVSNLRLINHGIKAKQAVDFVDSYTTDIFSNIEGSIGYNIDGEFLFEGARILVIADPDILANNKIYQVEFITHNGRKQIHLKATEDSEPILGDAVIVTRGREYSGVMFHYNGSSWVSSQSKTSVNQPPKFDAYDENGISFSNKEYYPTTTFTGTEILSYKIGSSIADTELGFSLSYLNIDNVGDIQFNWAWETDKFYYTINQEIFSKSISTGFYQISESMANGWIKTDNSYIQPIIDSSVITQSTNSISLKTIDWSLITESTLLKINFYLNGIKFVDSYTRQGSVFTFDNTIFSETDVVSVKIITDLPPDEGYYEIPVGLEKNPLNQTLESFTLGQAIDHLITAVEFKEDFSGDLPGASNLRDIVDYQKYSKRFLKHSGLTPLAINLLTDKTSNIIKSIQYAKKSYTEFKNNFLIKATELDFNESVADFVDDIVNDLTKTKSERSPFADSDMIGSGAYTSIDYTVDDVGTTTFALSEKFGLDSLSRRAVYVYINEEQLLHMRDYEFNSTFGFLILKVELTRGDQVQIREYTSTAYNHIPPTPTAMGMYKKYTPMKFLDNTYVEPTWVIQGHDGSITVAYDDYRDDLLLELEYRIYNNIKVTYNRNIFDIDSIVGGYYFTESAYSKNQLDNIVVQEFLKWVQNTNINYTLNEYVDTENSFTYTYSNMADPTGTQNLPGWWRGVYQWFYDTDRPHRCPWEMLGFSEQPDWWESEYGPAPYTNGNLLLWEDLRDGIIRQGDRAGTYDRYKRSTIMSHIPVDGDGNLLSPLESNLAQNFSLINNKGPFVLGDISPVEYAWRSSSEWPFAVVMAMSLLKPFEFINDSFDISKTKINIINQTVNAETNLFVTPADIMLPGVSADLTFGLVKYLTGYLKSRGLDLSDYESKLQNLNVALSNRLAGFADKEQQKYLLDSKSPKSSSSNIFIPQENYDIIFNVSAPISSLTYSAVIVEKVEGGWVVTGYDNVHPYFNYHEASPNKGDPLITVGGVSDEFVDWVQDATYNNGQITRYRNDFYRALKTHVSTANFDTALWKKLPNIPVVGGVEAQRRRTFNTLTVQKLVYGTKLSSIQLVVDFLLGYENYLISQGFIFDNFDPTIKSAANWLTSCKEFMYWTTHNWAVGSLITLSPAAEKIDVTIPVGVADNLLDGFYDYQVLKSDGKVLPVANINVNRGFQNISVETVNTNNGIYFLKLYFVLKEHVVIFSDRTVFNDVIYDKTTGYRQERIKNQGFVTTDWDGDYTSPGFLFDNVNIQKWQPFTDYRSGDIVSYRSYNWTSLSNQIGSETFNDEYWSKLDSTPEKQLVSNFDYKINQFEDYYEVSADGLGNSQRSLARHSIGYQPREYLQNLAEDPVTQFQLYQGFIKEKGTNNSITKVFDKLSNSTSGSVELKEEWAFRVGRLGGVDQLREVEMTLYKDKFVINPQPIIIATELSEALTDQYYRVLKTDFTIDPGKYSTDINSTTNDSLLSRVPGYVKTDHIDVVVSTRDSILDLDIENFEENDHVWVTFDQYSWTVLRYNESPILVITNITKEKTKITIEVGRFHECNVDDIIGIKDIPNLTGFHKIVSVTPRTITVEVAANAKEPEWDGSSIINLKLFSEARFASYEDISPQQAALLTTGSKLWIDDNSQNGWEVVQKTKQFIIKELLDPGIAEPKHLGTKTLYNSLTQQTIASIPDTGYVMIYGSVVSGLAVFQVLTPAESIRSSVTGSFGNAIALSPDGKQLIVGSPAAGFLTSYYKGTFNPSTAYQPNDIVQWDNQLWVAQVALATPPYPSSISTVWFPQEIIPTTTSGTNTGFTNQGLISVYRWTGQRWQITGSYLSPRPSANETFGSEITISQSGTTYYASVAAKGAFGSKGRVYLFKGTTLGDLTVSWEILSIDSSNFALPLQIAFDSDGSSVNADVEIIKDGDEFGTALATSGDGTVLVVGAPNSDGQYFDNYRGLWKSDVIYQQDDVVKYEENYYKVSDSTSMLGVDPSNAGWDNVGDSSAPASGKVFVYKKDVDDKYNLVQTIDAGSLVLVDDTPSIVNSRAVQTSAIDNSITLKNTTGIIINMPIMFTGSSFGGLISGTTYYVKEILQYGVNGKIKVSRTFGGGVLTLTTSTGSMDVTAGGTPDINVGDQFGYSVDLDYSGSTLIISSPKADINFQNQGSAYVFTTASLDSVEYRLKQKLESFEKFPNEFFGQSVSISTTGERIAIGAKNTPFTISCRLDIDKGTTFDQGRTRFVERNGFAGAVYVYEKKQGIYFLVEKLETDFSPYESFGASVDCTDSFIAVGSPDYRVPASHLNGISFDGPMIGTVRLFAKDPEVNSWNLLETQKSLVDTRKIKSISLYDTENNVKIQDIDYVDHAKLKILNVAEKEIKFKTLYDPATYTIGTDNQAVDATTAWAEKNVGKLWWDLSTVKWKYYEQGDISYKTSNWNGLVEGSSVDVYEWVQTRLLPSEWSIVADTTEGLALGISGQPKHFDDTVYSVKELYNSTTGEISGTLYFYWVKNKTVVPENMPGREISAASVAAYIRDPITTGIAHLALIDSDKFIAYNFKSIISTDTVVMNIEYFKNSKQLNPIHNEYQLLVEGDPNSRPTTSLETKWLDSLIGVDSQGGAVPDPGLPAKQKYGLSFRPRQSMFVNRAPLLKIIVTKVNEFLLTEPWADVILVEDLNLIDFAPDAALNLYDQTVDTYESLQTVGTTRIKQAKLRVNISNNQLSSIDIIDPGFGYRTIPNVEIFGDGEGAKAVAILDNQGRISQVTVTTKGKKYSEATATVRQFAVLVTSDETTKGFWGIYSWDDERQTFYRSRAQAFDTSRYGYATDWWAEGYSRKTRITTEIPDISYEPLLTNKIGDLIKAKQYGNGDWAVFERVTDDPEFFKRYTLVGRGTGTIQLADSLWNNKLSGIGFDNTVSFDNDSYDIDNSKELRIILERIRDYLFIGEYRYEWNNLFFTSVRYALSEQQYVDWAFKTSFLNATHRVGELRERLNYKNDNLSSYQDYLDEVKPYRTTIREYISSYEKIDRVGSANTDFDLPPTFSVTEGKILPVTTDDETSLLYPWKSWVDNHTYEIISIEIANPGSGYIQAPNVLITGNGINAKAKAYISSGKLSGITILNPGSGFTSAPTITLVGGNGSSNDIATAVAIIGNSKARTFNLGIKFDRFTKTGFLSSLENYQQFRANGYSATFELSYAPTRDKSQIRVLKNNQVVLTSEYKITLFKSSTDTFSLLKGKLIFTEVPTGPDAETGYLGDLIEIYYVKNDELLDSINRINKYYYPLAGMKGKDLGQLMTGIDFGGVQLQGTTFDVTGGWDALPWFTDSWDSVESSADFYVICDGSTSFVTLPFTPANGQEINVYLKRSGTGLGRSPETIQTLGGPSSPTVAYEPIVPEQPTIRIDDPYFITENDSSTSPNPNAEMPTFIGDGSTRIIEIGQYIQTNAGDTLIFRPAESDGSVTINDPNLLDTKLSGGTLATMGPAYSTATGTRAEDIIIDGGKLISPDQVPAPEEQVPGQVLESVSIKVFTTDTDGAVPLQTNIIPGNGVDKVYPIGLNIFESSSLLVYVDKIKKEYQGSSSLDYSIDFVSNEVLFNNPPPIGSVIEIIAFGIGGAALLDYQEFIADGDTSLFLTNANFKDTEMVSVSVNGVYQDTGFINSTGVVDTNEKTLIQFGTTPLANSLIKILSIGPGAETTGIVRVHSQQFEFEGSTRTFEITDLSIQTNGSVTSSVVVEVNGTVLKGVDTISSVYDGITKTFVIGTDPLEGVGAVLASDIKVFVNNELIQFVDDYSYAGQTKILTITRALTLGDNIRIENSFRTQYTISTDSTVTLLTINPDIVLSSTNETDNDIIKVTWFSEYPSIEIISDEYTGGKINYQLNAIPLDASYVWVYKNGERLVQDKEFRISLPRGVLYLTDTTTSSDMIKIVLFGSKIYREPSGYEIHKDMLNGYSFKRYSVNTDVKLSKDLTYYDQEITVTDASGLAEPIRERNIPGTVMINNERIEYLQKNGNTLSQLRRGAIGTSIATLHSMGSFVVDISKSETIPYKENQDKLDFISDGSTLLVGPLNFIPTKSSRSWTSATTATIPNDYGPCDEFEVFAAGARLRKDPLQAYNDSLGASSPSADVILEAEFSVDGVSPYIRLTSKLPAGTRISIIKKVGSIWYERGTATISKGITLLENETPIAKFIAKKTTRLPE